MKLNDLLIDRIKKIQDFLMAADVSMAELLGISLLEYNDFLKGRSTLKIESFWSLCRRLHLSPQKILFENSKFAQNEERYEQSEQKLSSATGVKTIISALDQLYGREFTKDIFYKRQIDPVEFLEKSSGKVSSYIPYDIFKELKKFGFYSEHFQLIGEKTFDALKALSGRQLGSFSKPIEVFECLIEDIIPRYYDDLYEYEFLKSTRDSATIKVSLSERGEEAFKDQSPFSPELESYLQGAFKSATRFIRKSSGRVVPLSSFDKEGGSSLFNISWQTRPHLAAQI